MSARDRAVQRLTAVLRGLSEEAFELWGEEDDAIVVQIVDVLHDHITDVVQEHAENAPHLYPDGSAR